MKVRRTCILCTHFHFDGGEPDYSELTPGTRASIRCSKGVFWHCLETLSEEDYRAAMLTADKCDQFDARRK